MRKEIVFKDVEKVFEYRIMEIVENLKKKYSDDIELLCTSYHNITNEVIINYKMVHGGSVFIYNDAIRELLKELAEILIFA